MKKIAYIAVAVAAAMCVVLFVLFSQGARNSASILVNRSQYNVGSVVKEFHSLGAINSPRFVAICVKIGLRMTGRTLTPGWYHVANGESQFDVIRSLVLGKREPLVKVTIPEGFTMFQVASRLQKRAEIDSGKFIRWATSDAVRMKYNIASPTMDGFLMPATYHVIRTEGSEVVGTMMADEAALVWKKLSGRFRGSRDSVITLASIVQKEAVREEEFSVIAGVYANRLSRSMRLEADPTLQHGRDLTITRSDLRDATNTYNTYQHSGLPPGPICNPGKRSIAAALAPARHDYIFFVAKGDSTNGHRFARNYIEHKANVTLYRAERSRH